MIRLSYVFLVLLVFVACKDGKRETEKTTSPRVRKNTSVEQPTQNQTFTRGSEIGISLSTNEEFPLDSVEVSVGDALSTFKTSSFNISIPNRKVGTWRLLIKAYSGGSSETHYRKIVVLPESAPEELTYQVENTYPHDTDDYTQGLLIKDGFLYESTGQRGKSMLKQKDITTGATKKAVNLASDLFGEGLAVLNGEFYQLTWTSGKGFVYDNELNQVRTFNYQMEGWGLATLGDELVMTDETEKLYFVEPASFTIQRELEVFDNAGKIEALNELEVIDGLIYANVYQQDYIVVVDPETGEVLQKIDLAGLLTAEEAQSADVLNGIAYDAETGRIFVTGKWWPKLFEVTFQPKPI
ncbi:MULTISPECIES: glutaminyl-peptide cyclotransferase [unclassified Ekhidna]|jgi:glutamine cyclotransferase|uniref:glutaminyl-peptide cyclotransferase n=1 Tax=unclassified Ekhidna TaxID=2632188 RepID=UPI0032DFD3DF